MDKLKLSNVTLAAMTSVDIYETLKAMEYSMRGIEFGDAVIITDKKPLFLPKNIRYSHTDKLDNIDKFNYKMTYELGDHIKTDFALIVHADGFVIHPESWRDEFLEKRLCIQRQQGQYLQSWKFSVDQIQTSYGFSQKE